MILPARFFRVDFLLGTCDGVYGLFHAFWRLQIFSNEYSSSVFRHKVYMALRLIPFSDMVRQSASQMLVSCSIEYQEKRVTSHLSWKLQPVTTKGDDRQMAFAVYGLCNACTCLEIEPPRPPSHVVVIHSFPSPLSPSMKNLAVFRFP